MVVVIHINKDNHAFSHIPPPEEDGGPEAVIAPLATDAMSLPLIYVFAVCPKIKSTDIESDN